MKLIIGTNGPLESGGSEPVVTLSLRPGDVTGCVYLYAERNGEGYAVLQISKTGHIIKLPAGQQAAGLRSE